MRYETKKHDLVIHNSQAGSTKPATVGFFKEKTGLENR
jgi:hypothetical protein